MSENTPPPDEPGDAAGQPTSPDLPPEAAPPAAPAPPPAPPAAVPAPAAFPQVLRTPWINPARRKHVLLASVLAFVVVAGLAFLGGLAAAGGGGGHHDRQAPAMRCVAAQGPGGPRAGWCGQVVVPGAGVVPRRVCGPQQNCPYFPRPRASSTAPSPAPSPSKTK